MAEQQESPIHWDQHSSRWNLTLIFALVVAVLGVMQGYPLIILGVGMAAFSWLTTPRQYILFRDRVSIMYGMPRSKVVSLAEISHAEVLQMPFGQRLRLVMIAGNRMMLPMREPMEFRNHLEDALLRYRGEQGGEAYVEGMGTVLSPATEEAFEAEAYYSSDAEASEEDRANFYADPPEASETYTGHVEEAASTSGSYAEVEEPVTEAPESTPAEETASASGSYTETAEPDFSGEGRPTYGADVEIETSVSDKSDEEERPPSPY